MCKSHVLPGLVALLSFASLAEAQYNESLTIVQIGVELFVTGTNEADLIDMVHGTDTVNINGKYGFKGVSIIYVMTGGGDDYVKLYSYRGGATVIISTENGDDTLVLDTEGHGGGLVVDTGNGNDQVWCRKLDEIKGFYTSIVTGKGDDLVMFDQVQGEKNSGGYLSIDTGNGDDILQVERIFADDVRIEIRLGGGNDTFDQVLMLGYLYGIIDGGRGVDEDAGSSDIPAPLSVINFEL